MDSINKPADRDLFNLAELYKVFGDTTRIRIIYALLESELCVGEICVRINMEQTAVSHQLGILRKAALVKVRKAGKLSYYSLDDNHVLQIFKIGLSHIME